MLWWFFDLLPGAHSTQLYSEIVRIDPERAGRITGMMLEILGGFSNSINLYKGNILT